jgi:hypothetical protein
LEVWDLSGSQWATSVLYLQGISLVRRNNEWHHFDPLGTAQVITNSSAQVVSNNLYVMCSGCCAISRAVRRRRGGGGGRFEEKRVYYSLRAVYLCFHEQG